MDWLSIVPPILTIALALVTRKIHLSLGTGLLSGLVILHQTTFYEYYTSVSRYLSNIFLEQENFFLLLFTLFLGSMITLISDNGCLKTIIDYVRKIATSSRKVQIITYWLGIGIFFDDYANSLIVGNTLRPITDRYRISREKLAYVVDSTAAPITSIALITTWIGFQVGQLEKGIAATSYTGNGYSLFLASLPYSFYCLLTLVFVGLIVYTGRDYGPMLRAQQKALQKHVTSSTSVESGSSRIPLPVALLPIALLVSLSFVLMLLTGYWETKTPITSFNDLGNMLSEASPATAMMIASVIALLTALLITFTYKTMDMHPLLKSVYRGGKNMMDPLLILVLAWMLGDLLTDLDTAGFLLPYVEGVVNPIYFPAIMFLFAACISFSTGSSFGTMAILYPLMIPVCWTILPDTTPEYYPILFHTTAAILSGAVFGDHCSPIADTTILSSLATGCDHIAHVKTQLPYALTTGMTALSISILTCSGLPWYMALLCGITILYVIIRVFGKRISQ